MALQEFVAKCQFSRPAAEVFAWHERPGALERMIPPWETVQVTAPSKGVGDGQRVSLRQKIGPITSEWLVEHRGYVDGKEFQDVALKGPFAEWQHTHRVFAEGAAESTLVDSIRYQLPGGALGQLLLGKWTRSKLDRLFAFRHARLRDDLSLLGQYGAVRSMRFLVSGASGVVGRALEPFLRSQGHEVVRLVRRPPQSENEVFWNPAKGELDIHHLRNIDAVIHLAGSNIAAGRWTPAVRNEIWNSRIDGTRTLAIALEKMRHRPFVFVSASGVGIYGDRGAEELDENSERGDGFLADVCDAWEKEAEAVGDLGVRPVMMRTGVVLTPQGGALAKMLPAFRAGLGGPLGNGSQWMSWISIDDLLGAYYHAVLDQRCVHEVNAVSPEPVTNREFSETLAKVLHRPAAVSVPRPVLRAMFGAMADEAVLASTKVVPQRLLDARYSFRHEHLEDALRFLLGRPA
jgi:uncharacterized protein